MPGLFDVLRASRFRLRPVRRGRWTTRPRLNRSLWGEISPPALFTLSFAALIAGGTLGLQLLPGIYTGASLSWLDAAFTVTSAVCVTGLIVVDTATHFTPFGQAWILLCIQLGGLGIIAFTSLIAAVLGQRMSLRQESLSASALTDVAPHVDARRLLRDVVRFTFLIEAVGAVVLTGLFARHQPFGHALWNGVFHSISAFCNAGFSTFSASLMDYQTNAPVLLVVAGLIVLGGLGFLTIEEIVLWTKAVRRRHRFRLSLHSRIVLAATAVLLVVGTVGGYVFETDVTLARLPEPFKWLNAFFFSVTARTAGFNSIDYSAATPAANFLTILLMFVGGSPGSTAGGAKTTTFALLALLAWARFRGRTSTGLWGRTVPQETLNRAVNQAMLYMTFVTLGILALVALEGRHTAEAKFLGYMFESVSAFNTVGLSMNITATLGAASKVVTLLLMFVGRVGPVAVAAALAQRPAATPIVRYAYEDVVVG
ncbi:MAG: TrkH family potassium uptake protein [Bacteroidetes bacterium]|nr:TrkH family potassium uptake protein [Bacteroidota bacterium]